MNLPRSVPHALFLAAAALLAACGDATEVAAEKAIEAQAAKEGVQAKVDLKDGQARITTTDQRGGVSVVEAGGASVTEAELGVPIYPGAVSTEASTSRVDSPEGTMVMTVLQSREPAATVAGFYRDVLKSRAEGKQFVEAVNGDGATLMLGDDQGRSSLQVIVTGDASGADISITSIRGKTAAKP